jgi:hypothetical protein
VKGPNARLVRADLLLTGVAFSGQIDVEIHSQYGIFWPWCRLADLAEIKALDLGIELRQRHLAGGRLFMDWDEALARLKTAGNGLFRP